MNLLLTFVICFFIGCLTSYFAEKRGKNPGLWFLIGLLFGIFGLIALFLLPVTNPGEKKKKGWEPLTERVDPIPLPKVADQEVSESEDFNKQWFYLDRDRKQEGPMGIDFLRARWSESAIDLTTYVWAEGMGEWKRLQDLPGLVAKLENGKGNVLLTSDEF